MRLVKFASHSIDVDSLPELPTVLDVGCRGFDFTLEILHARPGGLVVAMDPDPQIGEPPNIGAPPEVRHVLFVREALVGDARKTSNYAGWSTGEGNLLCDKAPHFAERQHTVACTNITDLMRRLGISYWDVVKLDCEESEFGILENWPGPIAGQLSVEFHDWTGPCKEKATKEYYDALFSGPLRDYEVLSHELSTVGPGPAWGHWDTVLRLKK